MFAPSEDGHLYRWDLAANSLAEAIKLTPGIGEPYVPSIIGPDGTVFTLNGGTLFAVGSTTNLGMAILSSVPDLRSGVAGQSVTFTAIVTNRDTTIQPTGRSISKTADHTSDAGTNILATPCP